MTTQLTTTGPAAEPERPGRGRLRRLVPIIAGSATVGQLK